MPANISHAQGAAPQAAAQPQGQMPSFLKTGDAASQQLQEDAARAAAARADFDKLWRFFIGQTDYGKVFKLTFLDGVFNPTTKMLQNPTWSEHSIKNPRGGMNHYVCTNHGGPGSEPCPICANPNADRASTVMGFTVIDHRPVTFTKGDKAGKTVPYTKKIFTAKQTTIQLLGLKASKIGGLRGVTMDVLRTDGKQAAVGNVFEMDVLYSEQELQETFGADAAPANWEHELGYKSAAELIKLGLGVAVTQPQTGPSVDYSKNW